MLGLVGLHPGELNLFAAFLSEVVSCKAKMLDNMPTARSGSTLRTASMTL